LGVRAQVGRTISPEEHRDGANRVVVISDALWRAQYGGDPRIVGNSVQLNDESFTVVGVMPREMRYPTSTVQAWTPLTVIPEQGIPRIRFARWINMVGRLRDGVTEQQANQGIRDLARRLSEEHADSNEGWTAAPVQSLRDSVLGASRERLLVMFGTGLLILLLGCVNIANLVLSRATQRTRELSVRAALGASRGRLVRQLLTESILLSLIGGVIGVALASWGAKALTALAGSWLPLPADVPLDARVLLFALGLSLATGIAFGLIPAAANRTHLGGALRESRGNTAGRGPQLTRAFFVVSEVALAMMLVLGALFFARSFAALNRVNPGFDTEHTAIARITLPDSRYPDAAAFLPAADRLLAAVRARPGVEAAALIKNAPLRGAGEPYGFDLPARNLPPDARPVANAIPVSPGYFDAMGIPLVAGRDFTSRDAELPVVIISSGLAARYWPDGNAVGQEIVVTDSPARIIGVAGDAKYESLTGDATPMIYLLPSNMTRRVITIVARSSSNPDALVESMRAAVHEVDPELPITEAIAMRDAVRDALGPHRFLMLLVGMFGVLALILAAVGVFGVVSYVVGQRTNEIGIRTALGARPLAIVRATVASSMIPVVVGIAGGAVAAYAGLRVVGAQLFSVNPADPVSYVTVAAALLIISALAALVPAARAARVDPTTALRL
ncbi:MAG TPA: ABC transporter permease, partial [Longimicrobiales bacterium]